MHKNFTLSDSLKKRLKAYSLTAGALTAGAVGANGAVVYSDIDPDTTGNVGDTINIDVNNDGNVDFVFLAASTGTTGTTSYSIQQVFGVGVGAGAIAGAVSNNLIYPYVIDQNDLIGGTLSFNGDSYLQTMAWQTYYNGSIFTYGNWNNATDKYLGLELTVNGNTHFGWMRFDILPGSFTIKDFAYEDIPCLGIEAGSQTSIATSAAAAGSNISALDVGDAGNGSDVSYSFDVGDESTVDEYRVMVVKATAAGSFDLATAQAVGTSNYTAVAPGSGNVSGTLGAAANDVDGDAIMNEVAYVMFVMSTELCGVSQEDALSAGSDEFTLLPPVGIDEEQLNGMRVWAVGKQLNLEATNQNVVGGQVVVTNLNGQVIHQDVVRGQRSSINLDAASGVYILSLTAEGNTQSHKFMIQ